MLDRILVFYQVEVNKSLLEENLGLFSANDTKVKEINFSEKVASVNLDVSKNFLSIMGQHEKKSAHVKLIKYYKSLEFQSKIDFIKLLEIFWIDWFVGPLSWLRTPECDELMKNEFKHFQKIAFFHLELEKQKKLLIDFFHISRKMQWVQFHDVVKHMVILKTKQNHPFFQDDQCLKIVQDFEIELQVSKKNKYIFYRELSIGVVMIGFFYFLIKR